MALAPIRLGGAPTPAKPQGQPGAAPGAPAFEQALQQAAGELRFSNHASKRIERRDLGLDQGRLDRLNSAISRAAEKGARNSVVMLDDLAVVVDIRDRKVVTAINASQGKERVFTNIDSVVIA